MVRAESLGLNHHEYVKLHHRSGSLPGAMVLEGLRRFGRVEPPPQTHVKLHHRSGSLPCSMVRAGSIGLNHTELMSSSHHKSCSLLCTLVQAGSRRFGRVKPHQTHVKLYHRSGLLPCAMLRAGSRRFGRVEPPRTHVQLNHRCGCLPCAAQTIAQDKEPVLWWSLT